MGQRYLAAPRLASEPAKGPHDVLARRRRSLTKSVSEGVQRAGCCGTRTLVERDHVVPTASNADSGLDAVLHQLVHQSGDDRNLSVPSRAGLPRHREAGGRADGGVQLVSVEAAALAGRDGGTVAPRRVGVREALALRAVVVGERLAVCVGQKIPSVDGDVLAELREVVVQGSQH